MKVSLVLATQGRDMELLDFLKSLLYQSYKDFELIIIDQNKDGRIDAVIEPFSNCFDMKHVKVDFTGNARARDYGIGLAQGEIIAFPDDDCAYDRNVLKNVVMEFTCRRDLGILVVGSYDFSSGRFSIGVNSQKPGYFSRLQMMGVEFTHFYKLSRIDKRQFHLDHDFGLGSKYSGAEGFELLYRLLRAGGTAFYTPKIKIYHAGKDHRMPGSSQMLMYSTGIGAYMRKFANQQDAFILYYVVRKMLVAPVFKMAFAMMMLNREKLAYSFYNMVGIWRGFLMYGR